MRPPLSALSVHGFLEKVQETFPTPAGSSPDLEAISRRWRELGVRPGDLVLLCLPNGVELLEQFFGTLLAGGVPALVTPNMPSARLREMSHLMGARAIAGIRLSHGDLNAERWETLGALDVGLFPLREQPAANPGEVVLLTSGTSGFASSCVFDLEALLLNAERHADSIGQRGNEVVLVNLPLYFSFALVAQALSTFVRGGRLIISGPPFHGPTYSQTLARYGITISSLTPVLVHSLLKQGSTMSPSLRVLTVGGDSLAPEHVAELLRLRPERELYLTYGLTQAGPRVATLAAHREPPERYASVGRPLAETRVFLRDVGDQLNHKQLWVSSATVMKRTLGFVEGRPDSTHALPGIVATGDVFDQDEDGYLYYLGRLSDFLVRNGEKISLVGVRRIAAQFPDVVNARTRVMQQADGKEDYELVLQMAERCELTEQEVVQRLHRWLRRAEMPGRVCMITAEAESISNYK
jgi:acyl-CoA synthetase (AMP-forming)/AMP-acid ligase II